MRCGLQTHFDAPIDRDTLRQIRAFGFTDCRIDAQACSSETMLQMVNDAQAENLTPLVMVKDTAKLLALPADAEVEWGNEPDGDIEPTHYRAVLDEACEIAASQGLTLWAPAISNLNEKALKWLNQVRDAGQGWPAGLHGISAHSYGPFPHHGFDTREGEVRWLKAACIDKPFIITEFGQASCDGVSEEAQADFCRAEWAFWQQQGAEAAFLFQLNDGKFPVRESRYGIRRCDGSWKPSAETIPKEK